MNMVLNSFPLRGTNCPTFGGHIITLALRVSSSFPYLPHYITFCAEFLEVTTSNKSLYHHLVVKKSVARQICRR